MAYLCEDILFCFMALSLNLSNNMSSKADAEVRCPWGSCYLTKLLNLCESYGPVG